MSGGVSKALGTGSQKTKNTVSGWKPAMDAIENDLLPGINEYSDNYGEGQGLWNQSRLANENPWVRQGQNEQMRQGRQFANQIDGGINSLEGFMNYDPNDPINQARRDALGENSRATFDQFLRPGVEDRGTGAGQFGGNQQSLALGSSMQGLNREIASQEADMMNSDRNRALQATGMLPEMARQQFIPGAMQEQFGGQRSMRNQLEKQDQIQQFEADRNNQLRSLQEQGGLLGPLATMSQTSTTKTPGANLLQTGLGLGAMYLGSGGNFGSLGGGGGGATSGGGGWDGSSYGYW